MLKSLNAGMVRVRIRVRARDGVWVRASEGNPNVLEIWNAGMVRIRLVHRHPASTWFRSDVLTWHAPFFIASFGHVDNLFLPEALVTGCKVRLQPIHVNVDLQTRGSAGGNADGGAR